MKLAGLDTKAVARRRIPYTRAGLVIDPTNPLDRTFMDEIAGAINRRERDVYSLSAATALDPERLWIKFPTEPP